MISIFIVEDEAIVALDLKNNLEHLGYSILGIAPSGEDVLEKLKNTKPDLIILDIKLQGALDGIDTAAIINKHYKIPFIFLSAYSDEGIIERAKLVEPYGYIIKPFASNNLRTSIEIAMYRVKMNNELLKLEMQLRQSEKLKAVGNLAGGIAHDFNNILTVILGYTTLIDEKLSLNEDIRSDIDGIRTAALRASSLTKHLLAFSRKQVFNPEFIEMDALIENISKMVSRIIPDNIVLNIISDPESLFVYIDQVQIEQVLLNLVINAKDAMPGGGTLKIQSKLIDLKQKLLVTTGTIPKGNYVTISVTDNGTGISPDIIDHIFDPFFTTKAIQKGTGLGLASVYGIIEQSEGYIDVVSDPDNGSVFRIYLKACNKTNLSSKNLYQGEKENYRGTETILVIEDEDEIRKLIVKILSSNGYRVYESSNPGEAILLSENKSMIYNLLITDIFMPLMNGIQLVERLHTMGKHFETIFISGHENELVESMGIKIDSKNFMSKPFQWEELLANVRSTLDGTED